MPSERAATGGPEQTRCLMVRVAVWPCRDGLSPEPRPGCVGTGEVSCRRPPAAIHSRATLHPPPRDGAHMTGRRRRERRVDHHTASSRSVRTRSTVAPWVTVTTVPVVVLPAAPRSSFLRRGTAVVAPASCRHAIVAVARHPRASPRGQHAPTTRAGHEAPAWDEAKTQDTSGTGDPNETITPHCHRHCR